MTLLNQRAGLPPPPLAQRDKERGKVALFARFRFAPILFFALLMLAAAVVLFFFPPEQHVFYPRCFFHVLTGLQCPGCGSLRAVHRLLHGDLAGAFRFNPLLVILAPVAGLWLGAYGFQLMTGRAMWAPLNRPFWGWALLAVGIVFGILRNLPI